MTHPSTFHFSFGAISSSVFVMLTVMPLNITLRFRLEGLRRLSQLPKRDLCGFWGSQACPQKNIAQLEFICLACAPRQILNNSDTLGSAVFWILETLFLNGRGVVRQDAEF